MSAAVRPRPTGAERIAAERARQIAKEGYTPEHDDEHVDGEIAWAAICYAAPEPIYRREDFHDTISFQDPWPWDNESDKRCPNKCGGTGGTNDASPAARIRQLEKSGALIAAEIDRLLRARGNT